MEAHTLIGFRNQLVERRGKLEHALTHARQNEHLLHLLSEVDAALERIAAGTFGLCETCHDPIEMDRLQIDPLVRNCLDHLTAAEQRALERDLDMAYHIQQGLLPRNNLHHGCWQTAYHYEPAGAVSGDYCDVVIPESDGGRMFFFLGDVAGKGVAASILMGHLHAMFRSLPITQFSLGDLVARANRIFCDGTPTGHYATLVAGTTTPDGELELSNAGHPSPLIVSRDGVLPIPSMSTPIGLFCQSDFPTTRLSLRSGESLVLYTDGLTEATNAAGEQYGEARLLKSLAQETTSPPQALLAALVRDMKAFRGQTARGDDLTVMVLQRT